MKNERRDWYNIHINRSLVSIKFGVFLWVTAHYQCLLMCLLECVSIVMNQVHGNYLNRHGESRVLYI